MKTLILTIIVGLLISCGAGESLYEKGDCFDSNLARYEVVHVTGSDYYVVIKRKEVGPIEGYKISQERFHLHAITHQLLLTKCELDKKWVKRMKTWVLNYK